MSGFVVKALTEKGSDALDQCIQEEKVELSHKSILARMKFHRIWIQKVDRNPLSYSMTIHPDAERLLLQSDPRLIEKCVSEVKVAMSKNGAQLDMDYFVEVLS